MQLVSACDCDSAGAAKLIVGVEKTDAILGDDSCCVEGGKFGDVDIDVDSEGFWRAHL